MNIVVSRIVRCSIVGIAGCCGAAGSDRLGGRDKKPHIAARSGGWFCKAFLDAAHIALHDREGRSLNLSNSFNAGCTSQLSTP